MDPATSGCSQWCHGEGFTIKVGALGARSTFMSMDQMIKLVVVAILLKDGLARPVVERARVVVHHSGLHPRPRLLLLRHLQMLIWCPFSKAWLGCWNADADACEAHKWPGKLTCVSMCWLAWPMVMRCCKPWIGTSPWAHGIDWVDWDRHISIFPGRHRS